MKLETRAKINLFLEVLEKRPDQYHNIDTVFQSISLSDEMSLEKKGEGFAFTVSDPAIPAGEKNLASRAYRLLCERFPEKVSGVRIHLEKRIPLGAGLGGGSGNAAGALLALNKMFRLSLSKEELAELALKIGMDVPFFLEGGTARGLGRGEKITPLRRNHDFQVLVVFPGFSVSTRSAYQALEAITPEKKRSSTDTVRALSEKNVDALWHTLYNKFEVVFFKQYPSLKEVKTTLQSGGCNNALLAGSGSAICGFAPLEANLQNLADRLKKRYPFVALTRPVQPGVVFY